MSKIIKLMKDQRAGGAVAVKGLTLIIIIIFFSMLVIDIFNIWLSYTYLKTQMDMSNRAVFAKIDKSKLADKEIYVDKTQGEAQFYIYLKDNLNLNNNLEITNSTMGIVGPLRVEDFKIYNRADLPATTPTGKSVSNVSIYTRISADVRPIFFGIFGTVNIRPYITTDLPL